jgi:hypothetical protein
MAEAIGIASGVAGLLSLTITVIDVSHRYVSSVLGASKMVASYMRELIALKTLLFKLDELTHSLESTNISGTPSPSFLASVDLDGCRIELENILQRLQKRSIASRTNVGFNKLSWPFVEQDTCRIVETLHRYRSIFHTALSADEL